ncbi:hypothetical protein F3Y22_tig00111303pilonHSYRG00020 [Hibiscus syriacus]|uniref:Uncharacterized protein n=1 Tax=Hibiscus syriacus TaxID=106335 RepID=A0A6A2YQY9_HIBSY|nr:hypothetical protein F3Y22_tig00111303pilonHSYRG00020 [Hibiscus syriacus]
MNLISGVMSRRVLTTCGTLCVFCPSLRARSWKPVKRYKRLIAEIFPRNKEDGPNDHKIEKLREYVSKNPLRIPKINDSLEQRCYKELRNENFQSVKIVECIYKKLLLSCQDQMTLFATSLQSIIQTLLDQTRQYEMQILGCQTLFEFVINQKDSTSRSNLEGFIPKVCQLAQEIGEGEREMNLRSAGLQALSSLIWLMGEHSHISAEFDNIVSVVLENYGVPKINSENLNGGQSRWVQEVLRTESRTTPSQKVLINVPSWRRIVNAKEVITSLDRDSKVEASVAIISAVSDVVRHLRRRIHCSLDDATMGTEIINWNKSFKEAVDDCLVGDAGPILDAMAVMLENIPNITVIARTTICVIYHTAQIIASIPNPSYLNKMKVYLVIPSVPRSEPVGLSACPSLRSGLQYESEFFLGKEPTSQRLILMMTSVAVGVVEVALIDKLDLALSYERN